MKEETVEEFIARGGKIKKLRASDDRFAKHNSRFHYGDGPSPMSTAIKVENAFRNKRTRRKRKSGYVFEDCHGGKKGKHIRGITIGGVAKTERPDDK